MFASLSIYGLYTYDNSIFLFFFFPNGMSKDDLVVQILTECSDFALIYPNFDFMKMLIGVWSNKEQKIWENLYMSENIEYNPIENYDRNESITRIVNTLLPKRAIYSIMRWIQTWFSNWQSDYYKNIITTNDKVATIDIADVQSVTFGPLMVDAPKNLLTYLKTHYPHLVKDVPDEMKINHRPDTLSFGE